MIYQKDLTQKNDSFTLSALFTFIGIIGSMKNL